MTVPDQTQRVEYLIDSIQTSDYTLQSALGLVRANTNNMRNDFEVSSSYMIEVDSYKRGQKPTPSQQRGGANIYAIDFSAVCGSSGVDLRGNHPKEIKALPAEQKDELVSCQKSQDGKTALEKSKAAADKTRKFKGGKQGGGGKGKSDNPKGEGNWKKKLKQAVKTQNSFKTIMSVLDVEEVSNLECSKALVSVTTSTPTSTPTPTPTTGAVDTATPPYPSILSFPTISLKLNTILKRGSKRD